MDFNQQADGKVWLKICTFEIKTYGQTPANKIFDKIISRCLIGSARNKSDVIVDTCNANRRITNSRVVNRQRQTTPVYIIDGANVMTAGWLLIARFSCAMSTGSGRAGIYTKRRFNDHESVSRRPCTQSANWNEGRNDRAQRRRRLAERFWYARTIKREDLLPLLLPTHVRDMKIRNGLRQ